MLLEIKDLHVSVGDNKKQILKGLNLTMKKGEVHAIMGPNGAGKSTLSNVLAGKDGYEITQGSIKFDGKDLDDLSISERAAAGIFLSLQYEKNNAPIHWKLSTLYCRSALDASVLSKRRFMFEGNSPYLQNYCPYDFQTLISARLPYENYSLKYQVI